MIYGDRQAVLTESTTVSPKPALERLAQEFETEETGGSQINDAEDNSESIAEICEEDKS